MPWMCQVDRCLRDAKKQGGLCPMHHGRVLRAEVRAGRVSSPTAARTEKRCGMCRETLPVEAFGPATGALDGLQGRCRRCHLAAQRIAKGIHAEDAYLEAPVGQPCPICFRREATVLDHDHDTGRFRGWLCSVCNRAVGLLDDDVDTVDRAALYLTAALARKASESVAGEAS